MIREKLVFILQNKALTKKEQVLRILRLFSNKELKEMITTEQNKEKSNSCHKCLYREENGACKKNQNTSKPCFIKIKSSKEKQKWKS